MTDLVIDELIVSLQQIADIPDIEAEYLIKEATIKFMRDTKLFRGETTIYGQTGVTEYVLDIPEDRVMLDIVSDGVRMRDRPIFNWYRDIQEEVVGIKGLKDGECVVVEYYYTISRDACDIPRVIYDKYADTVVSRAVMDAFTGQPNSSITAHLYTIHQANYRGNVDDLVAARLHRFSSGTLKMQMYKRRGPFHAN